MTSGGYYWLAVTADEYELPLCVAETQRELAELLGVNKGTIAAREHRKNNGKILGYRVVKVRKVK